MLLWDGVQMSEEYQASMHSKVGLAPGYGAAEVAYRATAHVDIQAPGPVPPGKPCIILLSGQKHPAENGIYHWEGHDLPLKRVTLNPHPKVHLQ